ncbi:chromate transporter [Caloramator fervidus]|uniref:Chromate transporter n=1 Tax=Caloramator fervidus TaxID=29344 RepID=A0A1H5U137_9CLOT|nr:chromate transporter [Caloramator fervidus]SEF68785.1 chromate transporter [Caloramator fervidus]
MILLKLFITFFKIGMFSFGGGYAMLPLIQLQVVEINNWLSKKEFIDIVAVSQVTPGPIAINSATYIGYKIGGVIGAVISTIGVCLPSVIIMFILLKFVIRFKNNNFIEDIFKFLRPTVLGLILAAAMIIFQESVLGFKEFLIFLFVFVLSLKYKLDPILLTLLSGILGYLIFT